MVDMSLSQAVTRRMQASILLPSLPPPPPEVLRSSVPPEPRMEPTPNEPKQPTRAEKEAERRAREAEANSSFRSGFIVQERISLSSEALQLRQSLQEEEGVVTKAIAPQSIEPHPPIIIQLPIDITVIEPMSVSDVEIDSQASFEKQIASESRSNKQPVQFVTPSPSRSVDLFA